MSRHPKDIQYIEGDDLENLRQLKEAVFKRAANPDFGPEAVNAFANVIRAEVALRTLKHRLG